MIFYSLTSIDMTMDSNNSAQCLITMLMEQYSLAHELAQLSAKQSELIETDRTDSLLSLLSVRQGIIDKFVACQGKLAELMDEVQSPSSELSDSSRRQISKLVENINVKLADVMDSDKQDEERLQMGKSRTKEQLVELDAGQKAHRAYMNVPVAVNRFADNQG